MSKLSDAIKNSIDDFGREIIKDQRLLNILADYHAYDERPADRHVLFAIVTGGYADHLLNKDYTQAQIWKDISDISNEYGFVIDIVQDVYAAILDSIQIPLSIKQNEGPTKISNSKTSQKKFQRYSLICHSYRYQEDSKTKYVKDKYGVYYSSDGKAMVSLGSFEGSSYSVKEGTVYIADNSYVFKPKCFHLSIPSTVKAIGKYAFSEIGLTKLDLPSSVDYVDEGAFSDNEDLSGDIIHDGIEYIGDLAFMNTSMKGVELPVSLCHVGGGAFPAGAVLKNFSGHFHLHKRNLYNEDYSILVSSFSKSSKIELLDYSVKVIADSAFYTCRNLLEVTLNDSLERIGVAAFPECLTKIYFGNRLKEIDSFAFYESHIEEAQLPSSLEIIGDEAFAYSRLCEITIPQNVKYIGKGAFSGCEMLCDIICESPHFEVVNGALYDKTQKRLISYFGTDKVLEIKSGTEIVDREAFNDNIHINSIVLPESIKEIEYLTFSYCPNLKEIHIWNPDMPTGFVPVGVKLIKEYETKGKQKE